jgi:hypothetical protein
MFRHCDIEATRARYRLARCQTGLGNGVISRRIEHRELLQHQPLAMLEVDYPFLPDVSRFVDDPARALATLAIDKRSGSCRLRHMNMRLVRAHQ